MNGADSRERNIPMMIAAILLCLTLVSMWLLSGIFARLAFSSDGDDRARAAHFNVTGSGFSQTIDITAVLDPGGSLSYTGDDAFTIKNNSEVTVQYTLTIRNTTKNLPLTLTVNGEDETTAFKSTTGYTYTAVLPPNQTEGTPFAFVIAWPAAENDPVYSGQLDNIVVTVSAVQVD